MQRPRTLIWAMFLLGIELSSATQARAARFVPASLSAPSSRVVGLDLSGAARLLADREVAGATFLPPPAVSQPPTRKLIFRHRTRLVPPADSATPTLSQR